jgi:hypothetical protein
MSDRTATPREKENAAGPPASRLRRSVLWVLFAMVMAIPNMLALRRRAALWNFIRFVLVAGGAGVVALGWIHRSFAGIAAGALLLLCGLIPPERKRRSTDQRARELGALIVVDGGYYQLSPSTMREARLFVAPDRVCVLDAKLEPLLEIPLASVTGVTVEAEGDSARLSVVSRDTSANFFYRGPFAAHFAGVAESTLRSQLHKELPILR